MKDILSPNNQSLHINTDTMKTSNRNYSNRGRNLGISKMNNMNFKPEKPFNSKTTKENKSISFEGTIN